MKKITINIDDLNLLIDFYTMIRDSYKLQKQFDLSYLECINKLNELRSKL